MTCTEQVENIANKQSKLECSTGCTSCLQPLYAFRTAGEMTWRNGVVWFIRVVTFYHVLQGTIHSINQCRLTVKVNQD